MMNKSGQALIEYLLLLTLFVFVGTRIVSGVSDYLGTSFANFNTVLAAHLSVGICENECFSGRYLNGKRL